MQKNSNFEYIYRFNHREHEEELCFLESRMLFDLNINGKALISTKKINPSTSPFIKERLEIIYRTPSFSNLIALIDESKISANDFKIEYLKLSTENPHYKKRKELCKSVGLKINGYPSFTDPKIIYGITYYNGSWYFGIVTKNCNEWLKHNEKPCSYSSSIGINIAKALVNIASKGDITKKLIDPCCGVGTVLLEGLFAGYNIEGWEIKSKIAEGARRNLIHYDYPLKVANGDIEDINDTYDAAIVDMPYGILCHTSEENQLKIIRNAKRISRRVVLVSSSDLSPIIMNEGLKVLDYCQIGKGIKGSNFKRNVWVCE